MESAEHLLTPLRVDEHSLRLDCAAHLLTRLSVCGVHLADEREIADLDFMQDAIIPGPDYPIGPGDAGLLAPFLVDRDTPPGLCLGLGEIELSDPAVSEILTEATRPEFKPHYGSIHALGEFKGRLIDVLTARPGTRTTTVIDPRIQQYSELRQGVWVGMHYDNALNGDGVGERFPCAIRVESADRRVLCNIGPGPRRLVLALNLTSLHLSEKVHPGDGENIPDTAQLHAFLRDNPAEISKIVCIVVTLKPGEYVLFPAGIAIHDGSMHECPEVSRAIVLGGRFPRRDVFAGESIAVDAVDSVWEPA